MKQLFAPFQKGNFRLKNHLVMAPVTRSRAIGNIPTPVMAAYYARRSGAGLIVTEGTSPSPEGLGYPRIPGIYCKAQIEGWKDVTGAVHQNGSKIFLQLMHTGRIAHVANLPDGLQPVGPTAVKAAGEIFTDDRGTQEHSVPIALTTKDISRVIADFIKASQNAIIAGFDGVELHGSGGYLLEQFLDPNVNSRTDDYGGNIQNRTRLVIEIAKGIAAAIGPERTGIRLAPFSGSCGQPANCEDEEHQTYEYLCEELDKTGIVYIHISCNPAMPEKTFRAIRRVFNQVLIVSDNLTMKTAEALLQDGAADLVAFRRGGLTNPDFIRRMEKSGLCRDSANSCPQLKENKDHSRKN